MKDLVRAGKTAKEIAKLLHISVGSVTKTKHDLGLVKGARAAAAKKSAQARWKKKGIAIGSAAKESVVALSKSGLTAQAVADKLHISKETVKRIKRKAGLNRATIKAASVAAK